MAANTDLLTKVGAPGTATTLAAPGFTIGNTSISVGNTANWPTDTGVVFAVDQVTTQIINGVSTQVRVAGTYCEFEGTVLSSTQIGNLVLKQGPSQSYPAGSNTRVYIPVASTRENNIVTWGTAQHNQNGTHSAITVTSSVNSGNETVNGNLLLGTNSNLTLNTQNPFSGTNYVASGLIWSTVSGLNGTMTSGYVWINGHPVSVATIASRAFTASKDTYIDVLDAGNGTGTVVYTEVANNATSPALAANSVRIGICVSGASITSWNQGSIFALTPTYGMAYGLTVADSLGNLIYPRTSNQRLKVAQSRTTQAAPTEGFSASQVTANALPGTYNFFGVVGREYRIRVVEPNITVSAGGTTNLILWPYVDGVQVGQMMAAYNSASFGFESSAVYECTSTGSHALTFKYSTAGTSVTFTFNNLATSPAIMTVEEIN